MIEGVTEHEAAEASGLDAASFFSYMKHARAGESEYVDFARIIEDAKMQRKTWRKEHP